MPIPIIVCYFGDKLLPEAVVATVVSMVPISITSTYLALMYAVMLTYLPFSMAMIYKSSIATPNNVAPRKQNEQLKVTHPAFARILAAESNMLEGFPFFAVAVLAANQAGVPSATTCMYATFWLVVRAAFCIVYAIANNVLLSVLRSSLWAFSMMTVGKLFALAVAAGN